MSYPLRGLRFRLAGVYLLWFGSLLAAGGTLFVLLVERSYRADLDRTLVETIAAARALYAEDRPEFPSLPATVAHVLTELIYADRAMVAWDAGGTLVGQSRRYPGAPAVAELGNRPVPRPATVQTSSGRARVLSGELPEGVHLLVGIALAPTARQRRTLQLALFVGLPLLLLASAGVGVLTARRALRPIGEVAEAAKRTGVLVEAGAQDFPPLPDRAINDEVGELATEFNRLLRRLATALGRERTFLADAAHELRTPIAIIMSEADAAIALPREAARDEAAFRGVAEEAQRMGTIVADLLLLAQGEAAQPGASHETFYLDDAVAHLLVRARRLPVAQGRTLRLGEFEAAPVSGNRRLIERAVLGLLDNAFMHAAPAAVEVSVGVRQEGERSWSWVQVRDWGPGIPGTARERVFERFGRGDTTAPGSGLGLAIARWVAERHGGLLRHVAPPDGGAAFLLELPAPEPPAAAAGPAS
ncbi:MAG TPA: HAMP domain-containing sensor histidine kinase [Gemmatimonadales bacterium]|nr:HAMP domain-containing sensor histidine kinase [Gemmatimonadales bacterium]